MLEIEIEYKRGILFARLFGELNKSTSSSLNILDIMIQKAGIKYLLLNLEKVSIIQIDEFERLTNKYKEMIGNDGKLLICSNNNYESLKVNKKESIDSIFKTSNELTAFNMINI